MVKEVRNGLTDTELGESDERMINQFLRATKMDVQQAVKRLKATIAWRLKEQPHRRICTMCAKTSGSHYLQVVMFQKTKALLVVLLCLVLPYLFCSSQ